jgi:hypothetical protein
MRGGADLAGRLRQPHKTIEVLEGQRQVHIARPGITSGERPCQGDFKYGGELLDLPGESLRGLGKESGSSAFHVIRAVLIIAVPT